MKPDRDMLPTSEKGLRVRYPSVASMKERHYRWPSSPELKKVWLFVWVEMAFLGAIFGAAWLGAKFFAVALATAISGGIAYALLRSTNVVLNPHSIKFPATFACELHGKLTRSWDDLEAINISPVRNGANEVKIGTVISLSFRSGGRADLELCRLHEDDLKLLIEALETYAPPEVRDANIKLLHAQHKIERSNTSAYSFIRARNESLCPEYGLAAFVPRRKDDLLADGEVTIISDLSCGGISASYVAASSNGNLLVREFWLGHLSPSEQESVLQNLMNEAQKLLVGENTERPCGQCGLVRFFAESDRFYLCYEHRSGRNLSQMVRRNGFLTEKAGAWRMLQLARALNNFRNAYPGTVHGAITPSQILVPDGKNRTLLAEAELFFSELGFAQNILSEQACTVLGDMSYLAPEQLTGQSFKQEESDIYALAAVGQFLTTGEDPPIGSILHPRCVIAGISSAFDDLICQMSLPQPERRPKLEEVIDRLERIQLSSTGRPFLLAREAG